MKPGAFDNNGTASTDDMIVFGKDNTILVIEARSPKKLATMEGTAPPAKDAVRTEKLRASIAAVE